MRQSVRAAFMGFVVPFEGSLAHMYLDVKNLVTVGVGCLLDPIESAVGLQFQKLDGSLATWEEVALDWHRVKSREDLSPHGGGAFAKVAQLRLSPAGIDDLLGYKLMGMDLVLQKRFPAYEAWPADGQMLVLSMSWAAGPYFRAPKFDVAARALDFETCADECVLHTPRDKVNRQLAMNAANVIRGGLDLDVLQFPSFVLPPVEIEGIPDTDPEPGA